MTCPICDQKTINCDCTETERRQYEEIQDLRLTDEERQSVANMIHLIETCHDECGRDAHHLRNLLERLGVTNPMPKEISAEVSSHPKSDRIYVSDQDPSD